MSVLVIERLNRFDSHDRSEVVGCILRLMQSFYKTFYPNFVEWFTNKVVPGFIEGKRVIYVVRAKEIGDIKGVCIIKISYSKYESNKISSFFILPEIAGQGIGPILMEKAITEMSLNPHSNAITLTVPEEKMIFNSAHKNFGTFLERYGFALIAIEENRYRPGKKEFIYELTLQNGENVVGQDQEWKR
jgi:GNAT superfamily N-acetyltransferase